MRAVNRGHADRIREEIEYVLKDEIDYLQRNYNSYSFTVVGRNGRKMSIAGDLAYHLTDGFSERGDQIIRLAPKHRNYYYDLPHDFFAGIDYSVNVPGTAYPQAYSTTYIHQEVEAKKAKSNKLNKLKLLYWSYFQKHSEKPF